MPTDITQPFQYDSRNDIQTVSGRDFYEQHALILGAEAIDDVAGGPLTANEITEITATIEQAYRQTPYFPQPLRIEITDTTADTLSLAVQLGNGIAFSVDVPTTTPT